MTKKVIKRSAGRGYVRSPQSEIQLCHFTIPLSIDERKLLRIKAIEQSMPVKFYLKQIIQTAISI